MRPPHARDPGIALAALARDDVTVQLIVDGHHVAADGAGRRLARRAPGASRWSPTRSPRPAWATASSRSATRASHARDGVVRAAGRRARRQRADDARRRRHVHALGVPLAGALTPRRRCRRGSPARRGSAGLAPARRPTCSCSTTASRSCACSRPRTSPTTPWVRLSDVRRSQAAAPSCLLSRGGRTRPARPPGRCCPRIRSADFSAVIITGA